ncbi:MAG: DUF368 domain-containing protein [Chloroflexota bacterium]
MADKIKHDNSLQPDLSRPKTVQEYLRLFFSGFAMGASDIVPGVSGGTMAFILGVYETLLNAIKSYSADAVKSVLAFFGSNDNKPTFMGIVDQLHIRFLIPLGLGLALALVLLSSLLEGLIANQPTYIFAFFAGLIIASVIAIGYKVKWGIVPIIALVIGTLIAYFVTNPELGTLGDAMGHGPLALFISGAIAICAMILPGISGAFILLVLGQYEFILGAVSDRDIVSIAFVGIGAVLGLAIFSRFLSWLLKRYEHPTIALLVGFMIGSMRLIYYRATHLINEETDVVTQLTLGLDEIAIAIALSVFGFLLVSFLDHMQSRSNPVFSIFNRTQNAVTATGD